MLGQIDEAQSNLRQLASDCHRTLRQHNQWVDCFDKNYFCRRYNVILEEGVEIGDEEEEDDGVVKEEERDKETERWK